MKFRDRTGKHVGLCHLVTPSIVDENTDGHYLVRRLRLVRDGGAAMASAYKHHEPANHVVLTKIDGTQVDSRNETPTGLTVTVAGEITSILVEDALLPASETVFVDIYVGLPMAR